MKFGDKPGRIEKEALERVERSTALAWYTDPHSWVPYRVQLFLIRLRLWVTSL